MSKFMRHNFLKMETIRLGNIYFMKHWLNIISDKKASPIA